MIEASKSSEKRPKDKEEREVRYLLVVDKPKNR
jgi:hypothetical protein